MALIPQAEEPRSTVGSGESANIFSGLVRPHLPLLYRLACRFTGNQSDAEDLLQELLARLWGRLEALRAVEDLRPWLARALHNLYVDQRRKLGRSPHGRLNSRSGDEAGEDLSWIQDASGDPGARTEAQMLRERLEKLVAQLPEEQRVVVVLRDVEGYRLDETAGILGVALGTVKSRLFRAHERLRELLQQRNLCVADFVLGSEAPGSAGASGISHAKVADDEL